MSLNVRKINGIQSSFNIGGIKPSAANYDVKNTFEFSQANLNRPEHRTAFTQAQLCGAPVEGKALYLLG